MYFILYLSAIKNCFQKFKDLQVTHVLINFLWHHLRKMAISQKKQHLKEVKQQDPGTSSVRVSQTRPLNQRFPNSVFLELLECSRDSWAISRYFSLFLQFKWASPVVQMVKNLPAIQETWVRSLGWEDPLEKEMAI